MAVDIYNRRTMAEALRERREPRSFLLKTFFPKEKIHNTFEVDIDIVRNKRRLAPFVNPMSEGKLVEHAGHNTKSFKPPYLKPKMVTTSTDLLVRQPGEDLYADVTPQQAAARQLAEELADMDDMIERREEWMAAQALFQGQVTVVGEGVNAVIDFAFSASHEITLLTTARWDNAASDPVEQLRGWKSLINKDSGLSATDLVLSTEAMNDFLGNAEVRAQLNLLKAQTMSVEMKAPIDGVQYVGRIESLDVWAYEEWFLDENGTEQPMVPAGYALLGSRRSDARRHYGAIQDLEAKGVMKRFPKSWVTPDPSARWVMVQSAPLPVPHQVDAFVRINVRG